MASVEINSLSFLCHDECIIYTLMSKAFGQLSSIRILIQLDKGLVIVTNLIPGDLVHFREENQDSQEGESWSTGSHYRPHVTFLEFL